MKTLNPKPWTLNPHPSKSVYSRPGLYTGTITNTAITAQADDTLFEGMIEARRRREARVASGGPVRRHPVIRPGGGR
jgi:hypothetical protein